MKPHTPGPWRDGNTADSIVADLPEGVEPDDTSNFYGGYCVAETVSSNNKPLIKAAPDLLAACEAAFDFNFNILGTCESPCDCVLHVLRAAITKAKGEGV